MRHYRTDERYHITYSKRDTHAVKMEFCAPVARLWREWVKLLHLNDHERWEYQSFLRQFWAKNLFVKANISPRNSSVTISLEKHWFLWHFVVTRCLFMQIFFHLSTMIETAWQNLSDELLILSCGLWRKHRIENKLSVNNLNPYGEFLERLLRSKAARSWNYVSI